MHVFKLMFGFIFTQPIYVTLRQMRLIQVFVIINSQWLLWYIAKGMFKLEDPTQVAIGLTGVMLAEVAAIWKCVDNLKSKVSKDE